MKIGILADSHDRLPENVPSLLADTDEIWHLGDVCSPFLLDFFDGKPLFVVRGNCDSEPWPFSLTLHRRGIQFFLTHAPPHEVPKGTDIVLHGHTHVPRDEMAGGMRFLNPGAVSKPRNGSYSSVAVLEIEEEKLIHWNTIRI